MSEAKYTPPKVWKFEAENGGKWGGLNKPTAGATFEQTLAQGKHPYQLYSMATPNGQKVTIMFEELLELGISEAEYDAFYIDISEGDQFGSDFVAINPNSKIPALVDTTTKPVTKLFESGSILHYLANKHDALIPQDAHAQAQCMNWLMWQMGSAPYLGGGFGHFYAYAPEPMEYPINRFSMEVKRQLDVLDKHLAQNDYMAGDEYSIADIAIWPWYGALVLGRAYDAAEFLSVHEYKHVIAWAKKVDARPAVQRGRRVNKTWGEESEQLKERHSDTDF